MTRAAHRLPVRGALPLPSGARVAAGGASWSLGDVDEHAARACLAAALEQGVQVIDTAGAYTRVGVAHHNEQLIADGLSRRYGTSCLTGDADPADGGRPLVVTKCGHHRTSATTWDVDARPEVLRRDVVGSLRALRADALDVCLLYWPDPAVPLHDSVGALADMQREGLVKAIGVSGTSAAQLRTLLDEPGATRISVVQVRVSALRPAAAADVLEQLDQCRRSGVQVMGFSPFGGPGRLAQVLTTRRSAVDQQAAPLLVEQLSRQWERSVHQLLLLWLLHVHPLVTAVVGSTRPTSITGALAVRPDAAPGVLTAAQLRELVEAVAELHRTATDHGHAPTDPAEER